MPAASIRAPLALGAAATAVALAMPGGAAAALCGLALAAALVAMAERRDGAMLAALGVAIGLGTAGILLAPLIVGVTIRRRAWHGLALGAIAGGVTWLATGLATGRWPADAALPNLWVVAAAWPSLDALIVTGGVAFAAWTTAAASARGAAPGADHHRFVLLALIGGALFVPTPAAALLLPCLLVIAAPATRHRPRRPANDNQPVRPIIRVAA